MQKRRLEERILSLNKLLDHLKEKDFISSVAYDSPKV